MASQTCDGDFMHLQDIIGQLPSLRSYAQICLFFPISHQQTTRADIIRGLESGLSRLARDFPWLTGHVIITGQGEHSTGLAYIGKHASSIPLFVSDLSVGDLIPRMSVLRGAGFPFSMLNRDFIAPYSAMPESLVENHGDVAPVLALHATFIDGGLLLNFAGQHHTMDMNGLGQIIRMLSKCCHDEPLTEKEIQQGNCTRRDLIPVFGDDYQPGPELDWLIAKPGTPAPYTISDPIPAALWVYFNFDASSCVRLKQLASKQEVVNYITTNDAVCALFWQRLTRARATRIRTPLPSVMMRAVDARPYLGISKDYLGHMVSCTYQREIDVFGLALGEVAGKLRWTLHIAKHYALLSALATMLKKTPDKRIYNYGANLDTSRDVIFSSWAHNPATESNFGPLLGRPEVARRARFKIVESLIYVMPKSSAGDLTLGACLREADIAALQKDQLFMSYATYIG